MAAATDVTTVSISINGIPLFVPKGELIVEAVKRLGLEIPIFCYHARMKPVGMCRMCLVDIGFKQQDGSVRMMPKPQAACTLPASEGMAVLTDSEQVRKDRKGVLEFLLINHPLDCPICDRGGECPLQNNTLFYGPSTSRFVEIKRHLPKAFPLSRYVTLDLERCIQCGRCVRFTEEISGDSELAFRFRGALMQPSTFELRDFTSKFSGNVIEICPVGALTSSQYRFRARPWDLETRPAICTLCSNGCSLWFDYRATQMVRVNGRKNEAVNEEWTCDRGKFGHEFYNSSDRLTRPLLRKGDRLVESTWAEAYEAIGKAFSAPGARVAALGGSECSNEDLYLLQRLFRREFKSNNLDHRFTRILPTAAERTAPPQTRIADLERARTILVFGTSLADDLPMFFLRVRKAWFKHGSRVIVAHHEPTDADSFAHLVLRYKPGAAAALASGLAQAVSGKRGEWDAERVAKETGIPVAQLGEAAAVLTGSRAPVLASRRFYDLADGLGAVRAGRNLANAIGGPFNLYGLRANDEGAEEMGILPDGLPGRRSLDDSGHDDFHAPAMKGLNTEGVLKACGDGSLEALWLVGADPLVEWHDRTQGERALETVPFLVVQAHSAGEAMAFASVVLPMTAPAEQDGTYTSAERRVQRLRPILPPEGEAKPAWRIFSEMSLRLRPETPLFNPGDVMERIAREVPVFEAAHFAIIPSEGALLDS